MRKAAARRAEKSQLPYNPANPYDTPEVGPRDDSSDVEIQSVNDGDTIVSGVSSHVGILVGNAPRCSVRSNTESMPPPPPPSQKPRAKRQHQQSAEEAEIQAYTERMQHRREAIEALRREKEELELDQEEARLRQQVLDLKSRAIVQLGKIIRLIFFYLHEDSSPFYT
jgi:hypothetical protein